MDITIVGAGAIGGTVGAHLAAAGHAITFVDSNEEHVRAIRERGLRVGGARPLRVECAAITPGELPDRLGAVFLAVKSRHTDDALRAVAPRLAEDGWILSLQNGLEEYKIARAVGESRTVGAFLTFGGHYVEPGHVTYGGRGSFRIGELDGTASGRVDELREVLSSFHPVEATDNIFGYLWGKMAVGAMWFATALVSEDVPEILARTEYRGVLGRLAGEAAAVAEAAGVRTEVIDGFDARVFRPDGDPDAEAAAVCWAAQHAYWMSHTSADGYRRTGVWRDLAIHHRPTEVDEIVECIVPRAEEHGVAVPRVRALVEMVHEAEDGRRDLGWHNLDELRDLDARLMRG